MSMTWNGGTNDDIQVNVRGGYFLHEDLGLFDAAFFSTRSSEAVVSITAFTAIQCI